MDDDDIWLTSTPNPENDGNYLCSLGFVLVELGIPILRVVEQIEKGGVYGVDRFGRFGHRKPGSSEAQLALDALAVQLESMRPDSDIAPPLDLDQNDTPFSLMGWCLRDLPDFKSSSSHEQAPIVVRKYRSQIRLVGALLEMVRGEKTFQAHPQYVSDAQLVQLLNENFGDFGGLSERNLRSIFSEAAKAMGEPWE